MNTNDYNEWPSDDVIRVPGRYRQPTPQRRAFPGPGIALVREINTHPYEILAVYEQ